MTAWEAAFLAFLSLGVAGLAAACLCASWDAALRGDGIGSFFTFVLGLLLLFLVGLVGVMVVTHGVGWAFLLVYGALGLVFLAWRMGWRLVRRRRDDDQERGS